MELNKRNFPAGNYIETYMRCGSEIAPVPKHIAPFYKKDKSIEMLWKDAPNETIPDFEHESTQAHQAYAKLCSKVIIEV